MWHPGLTWAHSLRLKCMSFPSQTKSIYHTKLWAVCKPGKYSLSICGLYPDSDVALLLRYHLHPRCCLARGQLTLVLSISWPARSSCCSLLSSCWFPTTTYSALWRSSAPTAALGASLGRHSYYLPFYLSPNSGPERCYDFFKMAKPARAGLDPKPRYSDSQCFVYSLIPWYLRFCKFSDIVIWPSAILILDMPLFATFRNVDLRMGRPRGWTGSTYQVHNGSQACLLHSHPSVYRPKPTSPFKCYCFTGIFPNPPTAHAHTDLCF
jgi:hypothetical protein